MSRKPDPDTDHTRYMVYVLRESGFSRRLVYKIMRNVFLIHRTESAFNQMYTQAKKKLSRNPEWSTPHERKAMAELTMKSPLEQLSLMVQLAGFLTAQALYHCSDPRHPEMPPLARAWLPMYDAIRKGQHAASRRRRLPSPKRIN